MAFIAGDKWESLRHRTDPGRNVPQFFNEADGPSRIVESDMVPDALKVMNSLSRQAYRHLRLS
jgi:hypothetical protein